MHGATALDRLADIYVSAIPELRVEIARAVEALNRRLAHNPYEEGESRSGNLRITFPKHLVVHFRVITADRLVNVIAISKSGW